MINDGYTLKGKIEGRPGLYPEIHFTYRPAVPPRVQQYIAASKGNADAAFANDIKMLVEHLREWDLKDSDGLPVPLDEKVFRIRPGFYPAIGGFLDFICGYAAPVWSDAEKN